MPEQSSLWASIVKYFVPTTIETMIQNLSVVLGARYYMREEHECGTFQRILRDAAVVSLFDGSTVVNLHALMLQFRHLARRRGVRGDQGSRLGQIFDMNTTVPAWNGQRLSLVSTQANDALEGVEYSLEHLKSERAENIANPAEIDRILAFGEKLMHEIRAHNDNFARIRVRTWPLAIRRDVQSCDSDIAHCMPPHRACTPGSGIEPTALRSLPAARG